LRNWGEKKEKIKKATKPKGTESGVTKKKRGNREHIKHRNWKNPAGECVF